MIQTEVSTIIWRPRSEVLSSLREKFSLRGFPYPALDSTPVWRFVSDEIDSTIRGLQTGNPTDSGSARARTKIGETARRRPREAVGTADGGLVIREQEW